MKIALALILMMAGPAFADHEIRVAIDRGTYVETASVSGSSVAGTAFFSAATKRMDGLMFNNTGTTVWIGTTTATQHGVEHSNITIGIPVLASATFSLDGVLTGELSFTCAVGVTACNVRALSGLNR